MDDTSQDLVYNTPWIQDAEPGDFMGTLSSSTMPDDTMIYTFTGRYVAWVAPGDVVGEASVTIDACRRRS